MSEAQAAAAADRLPWLSDEPKPKPAHSRRGWDLMGWTAAALLLVAGASFWLGTRSEAPETLPSTPRTKPPTATVPLPAPRSAPSPKVGIAPQPQVRSAPAPEAHPAPAPQVRLATPARKTRASEPAKAAVSEQSVSEVQPAEHNEPTAAAPAPPNPVARPAPLRPWQPRLVAGAAGRLVQIGAFGSVPQAKRGWRYMVRAYPAVAHLPAVVRPDRNSKGRIFYRFRIGTTSQAHSEVLCQRMEKIHLSCAVIGLPWKAKVER